MSDKRFNASLNCAHRITLVNLMGRVPVGGGAVTISPQEDFDLRNLAGAIDQAARAPGGCDAAIDMQTAIAFGDFSRKEFMASTSAQE